MYGYFINTRATDYLAEISDASSSWANATLQTELDRASEVRIWMHMVLTDMTMGYHETSCRCPLDNWHNIHIRVRGTLRAIKAYLEEICEEEEIANPVLFTREHVPRDIAQEVMRWPAFAGYLEEVAEELDPSIAEYERGKAEAIAANERGDF